MKNAIIIGSGIAGIAASLRLRRKGYAVDVYESNDYPGGKLTAIKSKGFRFDAGPSLFTMPHLVDELFELFELNPTDFFQYERRSSVCNYFWEDGTQFSADADIDKFAKEASEVFGVTDKKITSYLQKSKEKYDLTSSIFLEKSLHQLKTYISKDTLRALFKAYKMGIGKSLNILNETDLQEPHLVQLFNRYATYNGSSPYKTPGIMSMIPHLELNMGTFFPKGGMQSITDSLYQLAKKQGISFNFSKQVDQIIIKNKSAAGVIVNGEQNLADIVVSNMDIYSTYKKLMPTEKAPERTLQQERSSSALIFYWGVQQTSESLDLHNILFSNDYAKEFEYIFEKKEVYHDPTVYINISSKAQKSDAPEACENWFVMINTPGNYHQDWDSIIEEARKNILTKIKRILGLEIESSIVTEQILDPRSIESKTSSHKGSLYGASSNSKFSAFLRHPNFSRRIKNLYFCGGSVHPGGGIPLCLLSAKIVADQIDIPNDHLKQKKPA